MPIHLLWGDDSAALERAVNGLIDQVVDPSWSSINLSRLDGAEAGQAQQALEEARTPPFGSGGRLVLLQRSPFCNACPSELADRFEAGLELIPDHCHLLLCNPSKPDGRLRTTKALQKLVKAGAASERSFQLPAVWDGAGQRQLVERTAAELELQLEPAAVDALIDAIGSDSARLSMELQKLALHAESSGFKAITAAAVSSLIEGQASNALQVGDALLEGHVGDAISRLDGLIEAGEPALRIVATLTGQIRGWLWVSLLEQQGERDANVIAKAAGIGNPKRIYVMRKQLKGRPPTRCLKLLGRLLDVEAALKRGAQPGDAFRDGLLG
ncbi:DNA polymerase III subunit delta [Synechococcus sp. HK01-R]|uniref:DNA polymerase III subunit delta n=1 Tax=Synechococcus sp. HK01-R TaxID=2751171 RepID=UPI001627E4FD|nr:DNA polymerase III subunit delta [Synechococcus sp. HK01-R]QNG27738.1 DNA polymerase III subunit delta [Synechococcus sp. HK01-R]